MFTYPRRRIGLNHAYILITSIQRKQLVSDARESVYSGGR